jgi:LysM repeat protein
MRQPIVIVMGLFCLSLVLAACFRDAGQNQNNPTSVPIDEFLNSATVTPTGSRNIPTFTPPPQPIPTKTLCPGGPPVASSTATAEAGENSLIPTLPPTIAIPSFTPSVPGSFFGDPGITSTASFPTQPIPDGLITPTAFADNIDKCIHVVRPNDTLFSIATANGVSVDDMVAANPELGGNPNALSIGQELRIPGCVSDATMTATPTQGTAPTINPQATAMPLPSGTRTDGTQIYIVKEGDTLFSIAQRYNTTVDAIIAANPALASNPNVLSIDQELVIPPPSQ